jgi:hypothetical protein
MINAIIVASGALAGPPAVLVSTMAILVLLAVRAWTGIMGLTLTRRVSLYVDGAIGVFFVLFLVFVIVRFKSLAG